MNRPGNLPERSKGGDLRSPSESCVGSNPTVGIYMDAVEKYFIKYFFSIQDSDDGLVV